MSGSSYRPQEILVHFLIDLNVSCLKLQSELCLGGYSSRGRTREVQESGHRLKTDGYITVHTDTSVITQNLTK